MASSGFATVASAQKPPAAPVPTVQTAPQAQPKVQVIAADTASTPPICYAGYGLRPSQKIKVCTDVIDSGSVKGLAMGLAYFNRGLARANDGDPKGSISDYRTALRFYTDVIRTSAPSAQIVFQRGLIYHTMGDADQAIVDYSDAIRLSPRDTYAYVNRGIVLYTKKDNNEGAISDFNSALEDQPLRSHRLDQSRPRLQAQGQPQPVDRRLHRRHQVPAARTRRR